MPEAAEHQMKPVWPTKWRDQLQRRRMMLFHLGLFVVVYAISLAVTRPATTPAHLAVNQSPTLMQRMSTAVSQGIAQGMAQGFSVAHQSPMQWGEGQKGAAATTTAASEAPAIHEAPTFSPDLSSPQRHFESLQQAAVDDNPANRVMAISGMAQMAQASANSNQRMQAIDALRIAAQDGDPAVAAAGREALQQAESVRSDP